MALTTVPAVTTKTDVTSTWGAAVKAAVDELQAGTDAAIPYIKGPIVRTYTAASSTWTKPAGLVAITVEVQAAGGGSGGTPLTSASQCASGSGGGGGGYSRKTILAATLGATETVTVGAVGTAGTTSGAGGTGGTASFGAHCSATGGAGGAVGTVQTPPNVGGGFTTPGVGSGGDLNLSGGYSAVAQYPANARATRSTGGGSMFSQPAASGITATTSAAIAGVNYGQGASGGINTQSQGTALAGATGGPGIVIVTEYY